MIELSELHHWGVNLGLLNDTMDLLDLYGFHFWHFDSKDQIII